MRMPGATAHPHSTVAAAASIRAQRTAVVARAPFDILHNMKIDSAGFSLLVHASERPESDGSAQNDAQRKN
jgi:ABC-type transporter Mla MlaB component